MEIGSYFENCEFKSEIEETTREVINRQSTKPLISEIFPCEKANSSLKEILDFNNYEDNYEGFREIYIESARDFVLPLSLYLLEYSILYNNFNDKRYSYQKSCLNLKEPNKKANDFLKYYGKLKQKIESLVTNYGNYENLERIYYLQYILLEHNWIINKLKEILNIYLACECKSVYRIISHNKFDNSELIKNVDTISRDLCNALKLNIDFYIKSNLIWEIIPHNINEGQQIKTEIGIVLDLNENLAYILYKGKKFHKLMLEINKREIDYLSFAKFQANRQKETCKLRVVDENKYLKIGDKYSDNKILQKNLSESELSDNCNEVNQKITPLLKLKENYYSNSLNKKFSKEKIKYEGKIKYNPDSLSLKDFLISQKEELYKHKQADLFNLSKDEGRGKFEIGLLTPKEL